MLDSVRELHENKLVHLDIRPDNFRVTKTHVVKIVNFGLMMEYIKPAGHKAFGKFEYPGSPVHSSINANQGRTLSRRDDLESLGYSMISLIDRKLLPWVDCHDLNEILEKKK
jgi:serine/threonine protein kinase